MNGYFEKLTTWVNGTNGSYTVEHTDNGLARWVTIRRYDGLSAAGYGATYDTAAACARNLFEIERKRH
jgi:hypothetical protein